MKTERFGDARLTQIKTEINERKFSKKHDILYPNTHIYGVSNVSFSGKFVNMNMLPIYSELNVYLLSVFPNFNNHRRQEKFFDNYL